MHYCWHYGISGASVRKIKEMMENEYKIKCSVVYSSDRTKILVLTFDVEELHPKFDEIIRKLPKASIQEQFGNSFDGHVTIVHYPIYSHEEYQSAKWLAIRSSFSKVIPEGSLIRNPTCIVGMHESETPYGRHEDRTGTYTIRSAVKWRRNFFASSIYCEHQLFCGDFTRDILEKNKISGITFSPVLKKSTGLPMDDIYQLGSTYTIPNGAVVGISHMKDFRCELCGMHMLSIQDDRYQYGILSGSIPDDVDFCKTLPLFLGSDLDKAFYGMSVYLVSQRFYRVIKENMMDRSLFFAPIKMVSKD